MKKHCIALAVVLAATGASAQSQTAEGPWLLRLRATHMNMHEDDGTGLGLSVHSKTIPEMDVSYFLDRNMAVELNLTAQERYTLSSGSGAIGTFRQLPTTLMWQYHFTDLPGYKPYLGIGIHHTLMSSVRLGTLTLDRHNWGGHCRLVWTLRWTGTGRSIWRSRSSTPESMFRAALRAP